MTSQTAQVTVTPDQALVVMLSERDRATSSFHEKIVAFIDEREQVTNDFDRSFVLLNHRRQLSQTQRRLHCTRTISTVASS